MKFSISNLETARKDARAFGNQLLNENSSIGNFGGYPKSVRWLDAAIEYHQTSDLAKAFNLLESKFSHRKDTPQNRNEVEELIFALNNYVSEHHKNGYIHLEHKFKIRLRLTSKLDISGWIWLINMTKDGGRSGFFVSKNVNDIGWKDELKFPVIQHYIARELYNTNLDEVEVGVIDFWTGKHHKTTYYDEEIAEALEELQSIGHTITNII